MRNSLSSRAGVSLLVFLGACAETTPAPPAPVVAKSSAPAPACPTAATPIPLHEPTAAPITLEQLALVFPKRKIVVGFDVDDTLLFSAPAFNALQPEYDPDVIRPKKLDALTPDQRAKYHEFWNRLNGEYDDRSVVKVVAQKVLKLHLDRGDDVWIVSKRQGIVPEPKEDVVTKRYERMLGVKLPHPVVQTQLQDKTPFLCERHIELYYGDADTDVTASVTAGATPIRIRRANDSYAKDAVHDGQLGELVVQGSER